MTLRATQNGRILIRHRVMLLLWYPITAYILWQTFEQDAIFARAYVDPFWRTTFWNLLLLGFSMFFTYRATVHYLRLRKRAAQAGRPNQRLQLTGDARG